MPAEHNNSCVALWQAAMKTILLQAVSLEPRRICPEQGRRVAMGTTYGLIGFSPCVFPWCWRKV